MHLSIVFSFINGEKRLIFIQRIIKTLYIPEEKSYKREEKNIIIKGMDVIWRNLIYFIRLFSIWIYNGNGKETD